MTSRAKAAAGVMAVETALGWVGVAWSARGLLAVTLPKPGEAEALAGLPRPAAEAPALPPGLDVAELASKLRRYFQGEAVVFDEPLDPGLGTPFQQRVWALCRAIPRGQTCTYHDLAVRAGSPRAPRAVGQCMARNPWPPIVPCHRVLGYDGRLTGFGGGLELKRKMLIMEGALLL